MRRSTTAFVLACALVLPSLVGAQQHDAPVRYDQDLPGADFHRGRRELLMAQLPDQAVAVLLGAPIRNRSNDVDYEYHQSTDFLYLTGSEEPGSALLLVPGGVEVDGRVVHEVLFVPPRDPSQEVWLGRRFGTDRAMAELGVELAVQAGRFQEIVAPLLRDSARTVFLTPPPDGIPQGSPLATQVETISGALRAGGGGGAGTNHLDMTRLRRTLDALRTVKTEEELTLMQRAIDITAEAHRAVMSQVRPGWAEYQIEALVEYTFKRNGAEYPGFPSIVGSGENSTILHYESNRRTTEPGDLVVIDIGAEYHGYSADVTRTVPVDGVYSDEQRAIYQLVYAAQQAGIEAARAGNVLYAPHQAVTDVLARGMADLGLISSPADLNGLRRFFMHGTSHYLGLDVHDVGSGGPMAPGTVITVEPGIYIAAADDIDPKWWNIGIRIEDDVLITDGDPVVLSAAAPSRIDEIEALMRPRTGGQ